MSDSSPLERLISALQAPAVFDHDVERFEVFETHISFVLLTGPYAYKFKKPLDLGFLDFSTLEQRRRFCHEELRLNRRLAPDIYVDVVAVTGSVDSPRLGGSGMPIEYAVKMVQFPPGDQLDLVTRRGGLRTAHVDQLADDVASFHAGAASADAASGFGRFEAVAEPVRQNFERLAACCADAGRSDRLHRLREWSEARLKRDADVFARRRARGAIRECHGDLHLGNMVLHEGRVAIFDCIEFNADLRWIDTMSDAAFLIMDLHYHDLARLAHRFLNRYLERSGDYAGLAVLDHYLVYRALVRAKVACIRAGQDGAAPEQQVAAMKDMDGHLQLAERVVRPRKPRLLITHGLSGSGKTVVSGRLVEELGAVRLRSDVERKRLAGLDSTARSASEVAGGLYTRDLSDRTYAHLLDIARSVIECGHSVIVDAAFLERARRERFRRLADELRVSFRIVDVQCGEPELTRRVQQRAGAGRDASEAGAEVLAHQIRTAEPLDDGEREQSVVVDTEKQTNLDAVADAVASTP